MGAVISKCGQYRYALSRPSTAALTGKGPLGFCMLNPSTADAENDDATITKIRKLAQREGFDGILVVNVFAYRATQPEDLWLQADPVGPNNARSLATAASRVTDMVYAWGNNAPMLAVANAIQAMHSGNPTLRTWCLDVNKGGAPKHPLYVRDDKELWPYPPAFWHHSESDTVFVGNHADHAEATRLYSQGVDSITRDMYLKFKQEYEA